MKTINEQILIELYNSGKNDVALADLLGVSERTIQRCLTRLRNQGKIKDRKDLITKVKEKLQYKHPEVLEEVKVYLENAKVVLANYDDIYKEIKLRTSFTNIKQTEDMVLNWSDMHTGMINKHPLNGVVTYDEKIQEEELQTLAKGVIRFYELYKPSYNVETLYIFDEGDNITNDRIYEGQQMEITCGVGEQIIKTFNYQSDFTKKMLEVYPRIVWIKVPGNHARTTSKPVSEAPTNSFEYLLGKLMQERFRDNKRVEVIVPESYLHTANIRGHKYLITHGNTIRGMSLNSIERAVQEIALLVERDYYDVICIGHFHTALKLRVTPNTTLLINGCFIDMDDFAYHKLRKFSSPTQYLFNISKKSSLHNLQEINLKWR